MMKKVIAMALALAMMLSMTAFAAADFYDIAEETGVTVTKKADTLGLDVAVPGATKDAYYGVLLVNGTGLPTEDTDILYINQETAGDNGVAFEVLPLTPAGEDVTLYISSNAANATLVDVAMKYGEETPAGPAVKFMNGAETVATLNAVDGAVVAPVAPTNIPVPGEGALISKYEFVGWTDANGATTYVAGASIPVTAEMTLYAKYQMYYADKPTVLVVWGDYTRDGRVIALDMSHSIYNFKNKAACASADMVGKKLDEANMAYVFGDVDMNNRVIALDMSQMIYKFKNPAACTATNIGTPVYFINK